MINGQSAGIDGDQWAKVGNVPGLRCDPPQIQGDEGYKGCLILAHGAGAPMDSGFMNEMAQRLAALGGGVIRFEECWREVYRQVRPLVAGTLAIGGKSMGGRMASLVADELEVDALVCLGYPFYAVGKPEKPRVEHLAELKTPTLIVQGERDALGNREAVAGYALSPAIEVSWQVAGDHDLKPLKASGFSHAQHMQAAAQQVAEFLLK